MWIGKGSEFYHIFLKKQLKDNNIEMYSTCNEGQFVVAERYKFKGRKPNKILVEKGSEFYFNIKKFVY